MIRMSKCIKRLAAALAVSGGLLAWAARAGAQEQAPMYPGLPSETPAKLERIARDADFDLREVMIPMRDGVKLRTFILVSHGTKGAGMLLTRTPYNAKDLTSNRHSLHMGARLWGYDNAVETILEGGYIRVVQDIRGKYGSDGDYVMNRPMRGPLNPTPVDESTDTYDTIDWLVKNVPESNGRVGVLGISYDGFLALTPLVHPHPALKVVVPMNPMVDGWRGDDWFHNGAFRLPNLPYIYEQAGTRANDEHWDTGHYDDYEDYMSAGSAAAMARRHGMEQIGFWRKVLAHPAYDDFWQQQAMDRLLAQQPLTVPTMLVAGLWDQEDIYGAIAVYKALYAEDRNRDNLYLVIGPWYHGQEIDDGSSLGAIRFNADTGLYFRRHILAPFLARYLKDAPATAAPLAHVNAFQTGENLWESLPQWPMGCGGNCTPQPKRLYLRADRMLGWEGPTKADTGFDEYLSDPARPVPYRQRPILPVGYEPPYTWKYWLVDDQREFSGRTDVLTYVTPPLEAPLAIAGEPIANLVAATTGTDADWVVKLIDVYPDEVPGQPPMGGYQLAVAMDIFRGRYREGLDNPKPIRPNAALTYRFALPTTNHVFLPGHRLMIQVQSSWFPLYDRNPQTFVTNILDAQPADFHPATQRIYHAAGKVSFVELPVISTAATR
ncbi:MAG TPA: CocE/NonD family hydrolase [Steroidobacteraceae bacterium]